jgi:hypothetical protein
MIKNKKCIISILLIIPIALFFILKQDKEKKIIYYDVPVKQIIEKDPLNPCLSIKFTKPSKGETEYNDYIKENLFVKYLRFTLNKYINNNFAPCDKDCSFPGLYNGKHFEDTAYQDLQIYSPEILASKFIVLETEIAVGGGQSIVLMFKDFPDKLYYAWIYGEDEDYLDLRGFSEYDSPKTIEEIQKIFINQICDKSMGI